MPAVPVGLAEVERRLADIRRRLNRQILIQVVSPALAAGLCLFALVVALALRASAVAFAYAGAAAIVLLSLLVAGSGLALRRRWLSLESAAQLADVRAGLKDRLSTLVWLHRTNSTLAFTSCLLNDALERSPVWEADIIAPHRWPFMLLLPVLAFIALVLTPFLARLPATTAVASSGAPSPAATRVPRAPQPKPPAASPAERTSAGAAASDVKADRAPLDEPLPDIGDQSAGAVGSHRREPTEADAGSSHTRGESLDHPRALAAPGAAELNNSVERQGRAEPRRDDTRNDRSRNDRSREGRPGAASEQAAASSPGALQGEPQANGSSLPGTLQNMIRRAFNSKPPDTEGNAGQQLARNESERHSDNASGPKQGTNRAQENEGLRREAKPGDSATGTSKRGERGEMAEGRAPKPGPGKPGAAGSGTSPETLFGNGASAAHDPKAGTNEGAPRAFKLTLNSFLLQPAATGSRKRSSEDPIVDAAAAPPTDLPALNQVQVADDALRRADIPPEYEDIVRRIYSARSRGAER